MLTYGLAQNYLQHSIFLPKIAQNSLNEIDTI